MTCSALEAARFIADVKNVPISARHAELGEKVSLESTFWPRPATPIAFVTLCTPKAREPP